MVEGEHQRITRRRLFATGAPAGGTLGSGPARPGRSLGPVLDTEPLTETPWRRGRRLVDEAGRRVAAGTRSRRAAFYTAFPEGANRETLGAPLVVVGSTSARCTCRRAGGAGRRDGIVAYSKICTHAGCAIALYRRADCSRRSSRAGARLPVPLLDVRSGDRRHSDFGPGGRGCPSCRS